MIIIQYKVHLLLTSKHKILTTFLVYLIFYITLKNTHAVYCMTEGDGLPTIGEAKEPIRPSEQILALKREIMTYISPEVELLERIEQKEVLITRQEDRIKHLEEILAQKDGRAFRLYREIDEPSYGTGYKQRIEYYKDQVVHFSTNERIANGNLFMRTKELERTNALLAEAKQNISILEKRCKELERLNRI